MTDTVKTDFTLVMPLGAPYEDVVDMAHRGISTMLRVSEFEITRIVLLEEGELNTPKGKMEGSRYQVFYINKLPN